MAEYTKVFENPYPNGWEDLPSENTPITANALQEHTDAIENIEQYLEDNPIEQGGADVQWNQIQTDGTKIAEVTIDGETTDVFVPNGGGTGADFIELTKAEYDALPDTKMTDGIPRLITDYSESGGVGVTNSYSTTEQIIGKWIDGRYVCRKVFNNLGIVDISYNSWTQLPSLNYLVNNASIFLNAFGFSDTGTFFPFMIGISDGNVIAQTERNGGTIRISSGIIVVEYVKKVGV